MAAPQLAQPTGPILIEYNAFVNQHDKSADPEDDKDSSSEPKEVEWLLLDLQGELTLSSHAAATPGLVNFSSTQLGAAQWSPHALAQLHAGKLTPDECLQQNDSIQLRIGTNLLSGKMVKLPKPMLVCQKQVKTMQCKVTHQPELVSTLQGVAVIRHKLLFNSRPKPLLASSNHARHGINGVK